MGRIVTSVKLQNALVDTGAAYMVLPAAWKERLGNMHRIREVTVQLGDQSQKTGEVCGPVQIQLEGFAPFYSEVLFVDMDAHDGGYEPLVGYIPLEQSQAAVDMVSHRLIPIKTVDLKRLVAATIGFNPPAALRA